MANNLFEEIQNKRFKMKHFVESAMQKKWIDELTYNAILEKLENDTLTIGVIGQMKCGKSTFLNAFLFEDDVLPAATTPMTAALSIITYGEKKEVEAEFYNKDEWKEMNLTASRDLSEAEGDVIVASKIKAAKELVGMSLSLGDQLSSLLGTKKKDSLDNLIEYVGADGQYVAITKSVTISYPKKWLKGVEVVDTPGFNDPVVSREERTQDFLKRADVVVMLLYAGRAFDATDRDIVFEKVRKIGVGRILIGVNKYDLCYAQGETMEEIKANVTGEITKACKGIDQEVIAEQLMGLTPVLFSANMALMSRMDLCDVTTNEDFKFHWDKACDIFEISSQKEMLNKSHIGDLENAIRAVIEKSKQDILFRKPLNMIWQAGLNTLSKVESELAEKKVLVDTLSMPDYEIEEKIVALAKVQRKVERQINRTEFDFDEAYVEKVVAIIRKFEDITSDAKREMLKIADNEKKNKIEKRLTDRWDTYTKRDLPRKIENAEKELRILVKDASVNFINEIEDLIHKYLDDSDGVIENFKIAIGTSIKNIHLNDDDDNEEVLESESSNLLADIGAILLCCLPPAWITAGIIKIFGIGVRDDARKEIEDKFDSIDFAQLKEVYLSKKENFSDLLKTQAVEGILKSLIKLLEENQNNSATKKENLDNAKECLKVIEDKRRKVITQLEEMKDLKEQF